MTNKVFLVWQSEKGELPLTLAVYDNREAAQVHVDSMSDVWVISEIEAAPAFNAELWAS